MKQYVIDELRLSDYQKIKELLDSRYGQSNVNGIYWIELPYDLLNELQKKHTECQPYYVALDIEESLISCELLLRSRNRLRCDCILYANENQRNHIIKTIDNIFEELGLKS